MGNLRKHLTEGHPGWTVDDLKNNDGTPSTPGKTSLVPKRGITKQQQDLISGWWKEADTNPSQAITRAGFLRHFAAWILEDDQAWTTGEVPSLWRLFKYLQIWQELPSDTTVCNTVAKLYTSIHGDIVRALAVSILLLYTINTDHSTACEEQDLLRHRHMDDTPDDVLICRDAGVVD
jgi:hypothetical protein